MQCYHSFDSDKNIDINFRVSVHEDINRVSSKRNIAWSQSYVPRDDRFPSWPVRRIALKSLSCEENICPQFQLKQRLLHQITIFRQIQNFIIAMTRTLYPIFTIWSWFDEAWKIYFLTLLWSVVISRRKFLSTSSQKAHLHISVNNDDTLVFWSKWSIDFLIAIISTSVLTYFFTYRSIVIRSFTYEVLIQWVLDYSPILWHRE